MAPSRGSPDPPRPRPWRARKPSPSSSGWSSASAWTSHSPCRSACGPLMARLNEPDRDAASLSRHPNSMYGTNSCVPGQGVRLKGVQTRSCSSAVLVQQTAEQVGPMHSALLILGANGQPGGRLWRLEPQRPVRTVFIVVPDVDPQDPLEVAAACLHHSPSSVLLSVSPRRPVQGRKEGHLTERQESASHQRSEARDSR
jgi:hypothetical protein